MRTRGQGRFIGRGAKFNLSVVNGLRAGRDGLVLARAWKGGRSVATALALSLVAATMLAVRPAHAAPPGGSVRVIIRVSEGEHDGVEGLVRSLGGRVERELSIIGGFTATLPRERLSTVRGAAGVISVTSDASLTPQAGSTYDPAADSYSMDSLTEITGAQAYWKAGYTGKGIDVAVIDSGVSQVQGLSTAGKIVYGPDLSLESQASNLTRLDTYGHGTFMAGLIAGRDDTMTTPYDRAPASQYRGMAPDARIVSVKVATADGGTDVSQVIAAIGWVVQHAHDPGINIRVLNLSYGTNSTQSYVSDPLAYAAEVAWRSGIVVVAAAGNTGYQRGGNAPGLADPAYDPYVIGVGAYDPMGTAIATDDVVAAFSASSNCGTPCKNPDFVSVGTHIQGLRVPDSYLDVNHPEGVIDGRYFRGSGTSQSAAMTSGAIALLLQKFPSATPDTIKRFITSNATKISGFDSKSMGAGELNLKSMLAKTPSTYVQTFTVATGTGSLETARGQDHISMDGIELSGEEDIFGTDFVSGAMATLEATGKSWSGGTWNGKSWSGSAWSGTVWNGTAWTGTSWTGKSWSSCTWTTNSWSGKSWSGDSWAGTSWSGTTWSGKSWSDASWS